MDSHNKQRLSNRTGVRMLVIRALNTHKKDVIDSCNSPVTYKQLVNLHLKIYEKISFTIIFYRIVYKIMFFRFKNGEIKPAMSYTRFDIAGMFEV